MALHACINGNTVIKIIEVSDELEYKELASVFSSVISIEDEVVRPNVGWKLVGTSWVEGELPKSSIRAVTPRQMRIALIMSGISIESIESLINGLDEPTRTVTKVTWEYSTLFERDNPVLNAMAPLLGLNGDQVDELFVLASTI